MYKTKNWQAAQQEGFDWEKYFCKENQLILEKVDAIRILFNLRDLLKENTFFLAFSLSRMLKCLLKGLKLKTNPWILELGAATGLLTRWLIREYGGRGLLVDNNKNSLRAYESVQDSTKKHITYLNEDIFDLKLSEMFDLICSFGLVEHYPDKREVLAVHKKFLTPEGYILILVPMDTHLTRIFLEVYPELNLGYRELISEKELRDLLKKNELKVIRTQVSRGYSYDFVGALCQK